MRPILDNLLPGNNKHQEAVANGLAKQYAVWCEGPFAYLILEIKNELGLSGDPFLQGLVAYSKITGQDKVLSLLRPFYPTKMP